MRRYLQICCASNLPRNTTQFTVPQPGSSAQSPRTAPHQSPAPRCPPNSRPTEPPQTRRFPKQNPVDGLGSSPTSPSDSPVGSPTRIQLARRISREVSPQTFAHAGSRPLFSPSSSLAPVPAVLSPLEEETSFWTKFRSEQERLSLPRLPLTPALRNRREPAPGARLPSTPPKSPLVPDFPLQKFR